MTDKLIFIISNDLTWFISFQLNLKLTVNMANVLKESNAWREPKNINRKFCEVLNWSRWQFQPSMFNERFYKSQHVSMACFPVRGDANKTQVKPGQRVKKNPSFSSH